MDKVFKNVTRLSIKKATKGYTLEIGTEHVDLPIATNFEWRTRTSKTINIKNMYFGNETGSENDFSFNISFSKPYNVQLQNVDPRCYLIF
jgi:hypothetical protein